MPDELQDGCIFCGLLVHSTLSNAHAHQGTKGYPDRTFRLCLSCHRMYDHDILTTEEVVQAEGAWARGYRPDATTVHRKIEAELASGSRKVNKARQHKGAPQRAGKTKRRSNAARRAWVTRRQNSTDS